MSAKAIMSGALVLTALFAACQINDVECDQQCQSEWLDGPAVNDPCSSDTNTTCLVSRRFPNPDSALKAHPVILAVHGFTATTYEWREFRAFAEDSDRAALHDTTANVSLVLMGGHGTDIDSFEASTWRQWAAPIYTEYDSLRAKGYGNVSIACSSTSCTLLLDAIHAGFFDNRAAPDWIFMIDPIIVPTTKLLALADAVGPILGNSPQSQDSTEAAHWYTNRPEEDLRQLYKIMNRVKNELEDGITLPNGMRAKVYKSLHDGSADPVSALLIYKGLSPFNGGRIEAEMEDSHLHVFTRLAGRDPKPTAADTALQQRVFGEMTRKVQAGAR